MGYRAHSDLRKAAAEWLDVYKGHQVRGYARGTSCNEPMVQRVWQSSPRSSARNVHLYCDRGAIRHCASFARVFVRFACFDVQRATLLDTYVGRETGQQLLDGQYSTRRRRDLAGSSLSV